MGVLDIGYMGDDNRKIGKRKNIDSNWSKLSQRRICLSFLLSLIGQPGTYLSVWAIGTLIGENNRNLEIILKIGIFVAAYTGLLLHAAFCIKPLVYKKIMEKQDFELAEGTLETIDKILFIPVVLGVISLAGVTIVCIIMGIVTGAVNVPLQWQRHRGKYLEAALPLFPCAAGSGRQRDFHHRPPENSF